MVRLESFDNPIIYKSVCEALRESAKVSNFVAKLTLEKYTQFVEAENANWAQALMYLHKGTNTIYDENGCRYGCNEHARPRKISY